MTREPTNPFSRLEIEDASDVSNIDSIDWLIDGYIESGSLSLLFGDSGCGKTFAALDIAACVATGLKWHGCKVSQGAVLFISGDRNTGLRRRLKAWVKANSIEIDDAHLYLSSRPASFLDEDDVDGLFDMMCDLEREINAPIRLIVIDTLSRNFGVGDEENTSDVNQFLKQVDRFRSRFGACVLVVQHPFYIEDGKEFGSITLQSAVDAEYRVKRQANNIIDLLPVKMREASRPPPMSFSLDQVPLGIKDDTGKPVTSCALRLISAKPA